jgi:hypothetical protein
MPMNIKGPGASNAIKLGKVAQGECFINPTSGGLFMRSGLRVGQHQPPQVMCFRFIDGVTLCLNAEMPVAEVEVELNWRYK